MQGIDYVAMVRLTNKRGDEVFSLPGKTCERVPMTSLPWLAEQRLIVPRPSAPVAMTADDDQGEAEAEE